MDDKYGKLSSTLYLINEFLILIYMYAKMMTKNAIEIKEFNVNPLTNRMAILEVAFLHHNKPIKLILKLL